MTAHRIWQVLLLLIAVSAGCGGGTAGTGGGTAGTGGGTAGAGGAITPRRCGSGQPCSAGATCDYSGLESGVGCECDPSGHFFCSAWAGGGSPPFDSCTLASACTNSGGTGGSGGSGSGAGGSGGSGATSGTCTASNGYCDRTCVCNGSCTYECNGNGPSQGDQGFVCDAAFCADDYWGYGGCTIKDGDCQYTVNCDTPQTAPTVDGTCPAP